MKSKLNKYLLAMLVACAALDAQAYTITTGGQAVADQGEFTLVQGTQTDDFNAGGDLSSFTVQFTDPGGLLTTGNVTYQGAQFMQGTTGAGAEPPGDTTEYFVKGQDSTATATLPGLASYFGYFWSSPDPDNQVQFFNGSTSVLTLNGQTLATMFGLPTDLSGPGNQTIGLYVNVFASNASESFDRIVFTGSLPFETDNQAFAFSQPVPEPGTTALFAAGLGLMGLIAARRRAPKQ